MSQIKVSYRRHLAKTISYRIISSSIGFITLWFATGNIKIGAIFSFVELVYKPIQYYIHERVWYRYIRYGLAEEKKRKVVVKEQETVNKSVSEIPKTTDKINTSNKKVLNYSANR